MTPGERAAARRHRAGDAEDRVVEIVVDLTRAASSAASAPNDEAKARGYLELAKAAGELVRAAVAASIAIDELAKGDQS